MFKKKEKFYKVSHQQYSKLQDAVSESREDHKKLFNEVLFLRGLVLKHLKKNPDQEIFNEFEEKGSTMMTYSGVNLALVLLDIAADNWAPKK